MTKTELTRQLMDLAVAGYFNSEKFTKERLNKYIGKLCRKSVTSCTRKYHFLTDAGCLKLHNMLTENGIITSRTLVNRKLSLQLNFLERVLDYEK